MASCGQAAPTDAPAPRSARPAFAVAGVTTGMTPEQVGGKLMAAGYAAGSSRPGRTYAEEVAAARGGAAFERTGVGEQEYSKGTGESVTVTYIAMPRGPVARVVSYVVQPGVMSFEEARSEMTRRYGAPQERLASSSIWCAAGARSCPQTQPGLRVSSIANMTVVSVEDPTLFDRQKAAIRGASGAQRTSM